MPNAQTPAVTPLCERLEPFAHPYYFSTKLHGDCVNLSPYRHSEFALTKTSALIITLCGGPSPHSEQKSKEACEDPLKDEAGPKRTPKRRTAEGRKYPNP